MTKSRETPFDEKVAIKYFRGSGFFFHEMGRKPGCFYSTSCRDAKKLKVSKLRTIVSKMQMAHLSSGMMSFFPMNGVLTSKMIPGQGFGEWQLRLIIQKNSSHHFRVESLSCSGRAYGLMTSENWQSVARNWMLKNVFLCYTKTSRAVLPFMEINKKAKNQARQCTTSSCKNHSKHCKQHGILLLPFPAQSPDVNSIENMWQFIKNQLNSDKRFLQPTKLI